MKDIVVILLNALKRASADIEEMSCTCVDRSNGHQKDCQGVRNAKDYDKLIAKTEKAIAR